MGLEAETMLMMGEPLDKCGAWGECCLAHEGMKHQSLFCLPEFCKFGLYENLAGIVHPSGDFDYSMPSPTLPKMEQRLVVADLTTNHGK